MPFIKKDLKPHFIIYMTINPLYSEHLALHLFCKFNKNKEINM